MYSFTSYRFKTISDNIDFKKYVEKMLSGKFEGNLLENPEDDERYTLEKLYSVLKNISKKYPKEDFFVEGTYDTSSVAGEIMQFRIYHKEGILSGKCSEWYVEEGKSLYSDYEEFCECFEDDEPPLTEEEFEAWDDEEIYYSLGSGYGKFVKEVPVIYDFSEVLGGNF